MRARLCLTVFAAAGLALPARAQTPPDGFTVRVTVYASQSFAQGFGSTTVIRGYVDGTPGILRCDRCPALPAGRYQGRWDKEKLRIRWYEAFSSDKPHEDKYEVKLSGPKRDNTWGLDKPVGIVTYGTSEQQCALPIRLAVNVITKIEHPANWRLVLACTPEAWEKANLEFHNVGGTREAFTTWDSPAIPASATILTVLNTEQFDRCMHPGCYVHTLLHELGHFRRLNGSESDADGYAAEQQAALYREHPDTEFPTVNDLKQCVAAKAGGSSAACKVTGDLLRFVQAAPVLTNADVISMVGLNLSAAVVIAKIDASDCRFDTSPDGLRQLQAAHVPDEIVLAMIRRPRS